MHPPFVSSPEVRKKCYKTQGERSSGSEENVAFFQSDVIPVYQRVENTEVRVGAI